MHVEAVCLASPLSQSSPSSMHVVYSELLHLELHRVGPEHLLQQEEALSASREMIQPKLSNSAQDNNTVGGQSERQCHPPGDPGWSPAGNCVLEHYPQCWG